MKQYTMFVCDKCGKESRIQADIELCQAQHIGLDNIDDYRQWKLMSDYAKHCTARFSTQSNQELRDAEEQAYNELLAFEKEHGIKCP